MPANIYQLLIRSRSPFWRQMADFKWRIQDFPGGESGRHLKIEGANLIFRQVSPKTARQMTRLYQYKYNDNSLESKSGVKGTRCSATFPEHPFVNPLTMCYQWEQGSTGTHNRRPSPDSICKRRLSLWTWGLNNLMTLICLLITNGIRNSPVSPFSPTPNNIYNQTYTIQQAFWTSYCISSDSLLNPLLVHITDWLHCPFWAQHLLLALHPPQDPWLFGWRFWGYDFSQDSPWIHVMCVYWSF